MNVALYHPYNTQPLQHSFSPQQFAEEQVTCAIVTIAKKIKDYYQSIKQFDPNGTEIKIYIDPLTHFSLKNVAPIERILLDKVTSFIKTKLNSHNGCKQFFETLSQRLSIERFQIKLIHFISLPILRSTADILDQRDHLYMITLTSKHYDLLEQIQQLKELEISIT